MDLLYGEPEDELADPAPRVDASPMAAVGGPTTP